jgi:Ca-activated chloride channel family protein
LPLFARLKAGAVLGLAAALGLTAAPPYTPARAANPSASWRPSAEQCRGYGYDISDSRDEDAPGNGRGGYRNRGYVGAAPPMAMLAPSPPPPPPPPPPRMQSPPPQDAIAATAERHSNQNAPVAASGITGSAAPTLGGPMTVPQAEDTERYPNAASNPIRRVAEAPVSTFSIDVDTASYANVRRFLTDGQMPPHDAVRVEELINYFDYGYPMPVSRADPFRIFTAVAPAPWNARHQILHIGIQGYNIPPSQQPPLNLVFLVDTSGSMMAPDRLELATNALSVLVGRLRPQDRVSLVAYAGSAGLVLGPTSGREPMRIRCALAALQAGGSTAGGQGLELAYNVAQRNFHQGAVNRVILMTDGDFNVGIADPSRLRDFVAQRRTSGIYLSVYGFGRGNYNDTMMQAIAQNGNGVAGYIDSMQEAAKVFRHDFSSSLFPIANDVKIQVEFNPALVSEYRLIGYETRMLNREDFNNDQVDAGEVGSGASVTALYEITPTGAAASSDPLRYQNEGVVGDQRRVAAPAGEIAFVKLRYKRPGESNSVLMQQPVRMSDSFVSLAQAPEATRWATAVAAYGQRLHGDPWLGDAYSWNDIVRLALNARGRDEDGLRSQFIDLARSAGAQSAQASR